MAPSALRYAIALVVAAALSLSLAPPVGAGPAPACPIPEGFAGFEAPLPKTAKALATGSEVVIVTLGGSSSLGSAAGGPSLAWPSRLASALATAFPAARIKVVNLAMPRQTARGAADRLSREVLPLRPTLVIWETGTMEAVHGTGIDDFRERVQAGLDELRAAGIEVVLMSPQFSPDAEGGVVDLRTRESEKRRRLATQLYDCIGRAVADFVARGVGAVEPSTGAGRRP